MMARLLRLISQPHDDLRFHVLLDIFFLVDSGF